MRSMRGLMVLALLAIGLAACGTGGAVQDYNFPNANAYGP